MCGPGETANQKIRYLLVVGEQEAAAGTVAVRHRTAGDQGAVPLAAFVERAKSEVAERLVAPLVGAKPA